MRNYPIPDQNWILKSLSSLASVEEVEFIFDILRNDDKFEREFQNVDDYDMKTFKRSSLDEAFAIALSYLLDRWNEVGNPLAALEDLVAHFRNADLIGVGDRMLPVSVAGIGSLDLGSVEANHAAKEHYRALVERYVDIIRTLR